MRGEESLQTEGAHVLEGADVALVTGKVVVIAAIERHNALPRDGHAVALVDATAKEHLRPDGTHAGQRAHADELLERLGRHKQAAIIEEEQIVSRRGGDTRVEARVASPPGRLDETDANP